MNLNSVYGRRFSIQLIRLLYAAGKDGSETLVAELDSRFVHGSFRDDEINYKL